MNGPNNERDEDFDMLPEDFDEGDYSAVADHVDGYDRDELGESLDY